MATLPRRRLLLQTMAALGCGLQLPARGEGPPPGSDFWRLLREGGCVVLMRHAQTVPGVGDPPGFRLGDCSSQRQLSEAGRRQARQLGTAFTRAGVRVDEVRSSAWCRCTETAELAFGRHTPWPPLDSFFRGGDGAAQTRAVGAFVRSWRGPQNAVLVTHQVNITALTGEGTAMGELFALRADGERDGRWTVLARHQA
jgi:broad specificity phosphatase PhoE